MEAEQPGAGTCYFVDSTHSNSWRQLRVVNASHNLNYAEYDPSWRFSTTDAAGGGLQHYELYDVSADPYQLRNIYSASSNATRAALHAQLARYFACKGSECP